MENIYSFNYSNSYSFYNRYSDNICIYDKETKTFKSINDDKFKDNHISLNIMNLLDSSESVEYNCLIYKKNINFSYCTYTVKNIKKEIEFIIHDKEFDFYDISNALKDFFNNHIITSFNVSVSKDELHINDILNVFNNIETLPLEEKEKYTIDIFYSTITKEEIEENVKLLLHQK